MDILTTPFGTLLIIPVFILVFIWWWMFRINHTIKIHGVKPPHIALFILSSFFGYIGYIASAILLLTLGSEYNVTKISVASATLVMILISLEYMYRFASAVQQATNHAMNKFLLLFLLWICFPLGLFVAHDKLKAMPLRQPNNLNQQNPPANILSPQSTNNTPERQENTDNS